MKKRLLVSGVFSAVCLSIVNIFAQESEFSPSFHAGILLHTYAGAQQKGFGAGSINSESDDWSPEASLYRSRIMTEAHLTPRDYVFLETELTAVIDANGMETKALMKILDAQYDHKFADHLTVSAGKMLVSHNRNGLQTASTLMVNDFTCFQYPYNMSEASPLQNDLGRDIGINLSGGFLQNKLKYRLGAFAGKRAYFKDNALRIIGREARICS